MTNLELKNFITEKISYLKGKKVLVIVPDGTRSFPHKDIFLILDEILKDCDFMVALGTHPPMSLEEMCDLFSFDYNEYKDKYSHHKLISHNYKDQSELKLIGTLSKEKIEELSNNMFHDPVPVKINKHIFEYDHILIAGPIFPHEVVGCSGGHKYFFPGVSGAEITDFFHWLGACIFQKNIIGIKDTPVRRVVETAADFVSVPHTALCLNVKENEILDAYYGETREAWSTISDKVQKTHIKYMDKTFKTVLSICPEMYKDIWTAGKCMYKMEPILAERLLSIGKSILHNGKIHVIHNHAITIKNNVSRKRNREIVVQSMDYYLSKYRNFNPFQRFICRCVRKYAYLLSHK